MGRSQETFGKKEREKNKASKRRDKVERSEERKAKNSKGKGLDDMMAYIDEYGNIVDTPPDPTRKIEVKLEDIQLGAAKPDQEGPIRKGIVKFFNEEKGYGFINDLKTQASVFVHINQLTEPLKEGNKVSFEIEPGPKGPMAVRVKKI